MGLSAQTYRPTLPPPAAPVGISPNPNQPVRVVHPGAPGPEDEAKIVADFQEQAGSVYHFRGRSDRQVSIETATMLLKADELDYDVDAHYVEARGHVEYENYVQGEKLTCDRAEYHTDAEVGTFYNVSGSAATQIHSRPGFLTTTNPFYFQAKWAQRLEDHYVLHEGFLTDCLIPNPWWRFKGPEFIVYPHDHAIVHRSWFYVRNLPLFYVPWFRKPLKKQPRESGFLPPNVGHSSLRGYMVGLGYYWAINRSYDFMYRAQIFSAAGIAHNADFRGQVNQNTDFNFSLYALNDTSTNPSISTGGYKLLFNGKSVLGSGWEARGQLDLLSSLTFTQEFSETISEAINSETHSVGFLTKHWSDYGINIVAERNVNFQNTVASNHVIIGKLPEFEFITREHQVRNLPVWLSLESSDGFERRSEPAYFSEPAYQTRSFVNRADFAPRVTAAFHWKGINIMPSFGIRETFYDSRIVAGQVSGQDLLRSSRNLNVEVLLPSLERIFNAPPLLNRVASKVKHVIEPRIIYKYVDGVENFNEILRFDQADLVSNTNQVEFSLTNRLLAKDKNGTVTDLLSWQLRYDRYFDPTFGGAVIPGQRNVVASVAELTGYSFLDAYRHQSPIVSALRYQSRIGFEWRTDYDPVRHGFVNSNFTVDAHVGKYGVSAGHSFVRTDPILAPNSNQLRASATYGNQTRRGWNAGFSAFYDYRTGILQYSLSQVTYNTDCCGISGEYRRFSFGVRNENQFLVSFAVSNVGTFGTLKRQERIF